MKKFWQKLVIVSAMFFVALASTGVGLINVHAESQAEAGGAGRSSEAKDDGSEEEPGETDGDSDDSDDAGGGGSGGSGGSGSGSSSALDTRNCDAPLGFLSWDCGANLKIENEDQLKEMIWTVVANVAVDVSILASYLVLGYVIYGGYLYIFAGGDPNRVMQGKRTLTQAFIGLAIVMLASIIMNGIRAAMAGANFSQNCAVFGINLADADVPIDISTCVQPEALVFKMIEWVLGVSGAVALIFVVTGGILYITSSGEPNKLQQAKRMILYALIGMAVVGLAAVITAFVSNLIRESTQVSLMQTVKEVYEITQIG